LHKQNHHNLRARGSQIKLFTIFVHHERNGDSKLGKLQTESFKGNYNEEPYVPDDVKLTIWCPNIRPGGPYI